tara:strand:+ start:481 stop:711 length:231 start_codon:yes stop_codon:yes gene_type:complete
LLLQISEHAFVLKLDFQDHVKQNYLVRVVNVLIKEVSKKNVVKIIVSHVDLIISIGMNLIGTILVTILMEDLVFSM